MEQELQVTAGLAVPEDPECIAPAQPSPQGILRGPDDATMGTEPTSSLHLVPNGAPSTIDPLNPPVA